MEVFLQYLERPDIAAAPTEEYLRTLLKRYPWFTTARLMLSRISGKVDPVAVFGDTSRTRVAAPFVRGIGYFARCRDTGRPFRCCGSGCG